KIICIRRRILRICSPGRLVSSVPSNFTEPAVGLQSWRIARPVVDLPQPDSPTRPSVSPFSTKKSIPSTARTAPTWRWKMIPCVSGKCIFSAETSRRLLPLSAVAVLRCRSMKPPGVVVLGGVCVTVISSPSRALRRRLRRGLPLDLLDDAHVADLAAPVGVDEPAAARHVLRPPAVRLVIGLRVGDVLKLRLLLLADVAAVLAARLELAAARRRDEVRRQALDRKQLRLALLVEARDRAQQAPRVGHLRVGEELAGVGLLDDASRVHDVDALGHARDDTEVVGDEDERGAELLREALQQL